MEKKKSEDMFTILELNESLNKVYDRLAELEIEGNLGNDEYMDLLEVIRFGTERCDKYMLKYPLSDEEMTDFIDLLIKLNNYDQYDPFDYTSYTNTIRIKRFMEHNFELASMYHTAMPIQTTNDIISINGEEYDYADGIALLEESGQDDLVEALAEQFALAQEADKEIDRDLDDFDMARMKVESHIFMSYLLDAIKEEKNEDVRNMLIHMKYKIIGMIRTLEHSFLSNYKLDNFNIELYQRALERVFEKRQELYLRYLEYEENIISIEQDMLMERNKKEYKDIYDHINDILLGIKLQTHLSCIPNSLLREAILEDQETALELAPSKLDKKVLKRSIKLNNKYVVQEKQQ